MKRYVITIIGIWLVMVVIWACNDHNNPRFLEENEKPCKELAEIDSLMWKHADSAIVLLQEFVVSLKADSLDEFNGHYCQLLLSELLYKNYYDQSNRESLLKAVDYYDSLVMMNGKDVGKHRTSLQKRNAFLDARAHYINGVGFYEKDSVVPACKEYFNALGIMEGLFADKELVGYKAKFMALTYTHLCGLFSDQYLHEQAIHFGKRALPYYSRYDAEPGHIVWLLNMIGSHFQMVEEYDSAGFYYDKAMEALTDTSCLLYRDITTVSAFLSYKKCKDANGSLNIIKKTSMFSTSERERYSRFAIIGEIYFHEGQYDSAWKYLQPVFLKSPSLASRKRSAELLARTCMLQGRESVSTEYDTFLASFANQEELHSVIKSQLSQLCNNFEQKKQERNNRKNMYELLTKLGVVFGILSISIVIIIFVLHIKGKNKITSYYDQIVCEEKAKTNQLLKENTSLRKKAQMSLEQQLPPKSPKQEYDALMKERICVKIKHNLQRAQKIVSFNVKDFSSFSLSTKEHEDLVNAINKHCIAFNKRLVLTYPQLNANDIVLCRLYLLDLTVMQVAILLQTDYSSIRKRTNRLKEKMVVKDIFSQLILDLFEPD